jgi:hypothetical protein
MADLGFELLFRFVWGWFVFLLLVSRQESSERFLKIAFWVGGGTLGCLLWLVTEGTSELRDVRLLALGSLLSGSFLYCLKTSVPARVTGFLLLLLAPVATVWNEAGVDQVNFLLGAGVLGSIFMSQYLGHWFLNVPGMHIRELKRLSLGILICLGAKSVEVTYTLWDRWELSESLKIDAMGRPLGLDVSQLQSLEQLSQVQSLLGLIGDGPWGLGYFGLLVLITRILWGLVAPLILAVLVWRTVQMRSTQSATGILYAMSVMILIGEGAALFFRSRLGWNI